MSGWGENFFGFESCDAAALDGSYLRLISISDPQGGRIQARLQQGQLCKHIHTGLGPTPLIPPWGRHAVHLYQLTCRPQQLCEATLTENML